MEVFLVGRNNWLLLLTCQGSRLWLGLGGAGLDLASERVTWVAEAVVCSMASAFVNRTPQVGLLLVDATLSIQSSALFALRCKAKGRIPGCSPSVWFRAESRATGLGSQKILDKSIQITFVAVLEIQWKTVYPWNALWIVAHRADEWMATEKRRHLLIHRIHVSHLSKVKTPLTEKLSRALSDLISVWSPPDRFQARSKGNFLLAGLAQRLINLMGGFVFPNVMQHLLTDSGCDIFQSHLVFHVPFCLVCWVFHNRGGWGSECWRWTNGRDSRIGHAVNHNTLKIVDSWLSLCLHHLLSSWRGRADVFGPFLHARGDIDQIAVIWIQHHLNILLPLIPIPLAL